jgi:hypothetical protein
MEMTLRVSFSTDDEDVAIDLAETIARITAYVVDNTQLELTGEPCEGCATGDGCCRAEDDPVICAELPSK